MEKDDYLPLFWCQAHTINVLIVNNEPLTIDFVAGLGWTSSLVVPFKFLTELFENERTKPAIPEVLWDHFASIQSSQLTISEHDFLFGIYETDGSIYNFDLEIEYNGKSDEINFKNVRFLDQPLNEQFSLSPFETFILFSNILVGKILWQLMDTEIIGDALELMSEKEESKKEDTNELVETKAIYLGPNSNHPYENFVYDYITYLKEQIRSKNISFDKILRFSGAAVLSYLFLEMYLAVDFLKQIMHELVHFDNLTLQRKIIYFSLIHLSNEYLCFFDNEVSKSLADFYHENKQLITSLFGRIWTRENCLNTE